MKPINQFNTGGCTRWTIHGY